MGHFFDEIPDDPRLIEWVKEQYLFHVATAPLNGGHVNVSPKGQMTFKLMSHKACWYLDLTGSGNETISHLYEPGNGRLTIMFEAFQGPPRILRFWGKGRVFERGSPEFERLMQEGESELGFPTPEMLPGARAIIWLDITRVGTSCGYSVPFMKFEAHRNALNDTMAKREKGDDNHPDDMFSLHHTKGLHSYWLAKNTWSIDGLPGVKNNADKATDEAVGAVLKECGLTWEAINRGPESKSMRKQRYEIVIGILIGLLIAVSIHMGITALSRHHVCIANRCL